MKNAEESNSFLEKVDSIQRRFLESLITGQRDPVFRKTRATPRFEVEGDKNQARTTELSNQP